jgi:hypothetical protein
MSATRTQAYYTGSLYAIVPNRFHTPVLRPVAFQNTVNILSYRAGYPCNCIVCILGQSHLYIRPVHITVLGSNLFNIAQSQLKFLVDLISYPNE